MEKKPLAEVYYGEKITLRLVCDKQVHTWKDLSKFSLNLLLGLIKTTYPQVEIKTYPPAMGTKNRLSHSGFTLIEIAVILLIVGILSFGAITAYKAYSREADAKYCLNQAYLLLEEARMRAHLWHKPYDIYISGNQITIKPLNGTGKTYDLTPCEFGNYTLHLNMLGVFELGDTPKVEITNLAAPPTVRKTIVVYPLSVFVN